MSRQLNPAEIWSQVPVARRLIEVNTKTGFSLTAGSYSVRASSTQQGLLDMSGVSYLTSTISSVTTTRAVMADVGHWSSTDNVSNGLIRNSLINATTIQGDRYSASGQAQCGFSLAEYF